MIFPIAWLNQNAWLLADDTEKIINIIIWAAIGLAILILLGFVAAFISVGKLWIQAVTSGARVGLLQMVAMKIRKVSPKQIVNARIMAHQAGLRIKGEGGVRTEELEAHYLAGGNVERVIQAIIAAERAEINLDFDRAAAIDLAGRDVLEAVTTSVYPRVIECPDKSFSTKSSLSAIAKDGIELKVNARVTVRTNLDQLIGGATEETILSLIHI